MRWRRGHRSANVEDRRFESGGRRMRVPIPRTRRGGAQMGCGGILLLLILSVVFKQDFFSLLDAGGGGGISTPASYEQTTPAPGGVDPEADQVAFVSDVFDRNQDMSRDQALRWAELLPVWLGIDTSIEGKDQDVLGKKKTS